MITHLMITSITRATVMLAK